MNQPFSNLSHRRALRKMLPVLLALSGIWLTAGCFKIPVWEYRNVDTQHDFRAELGDRTSKRPVRPGAITKAEVLARFGKPSYTTGHGHSLYYFLDTTRAVYVWPLCFGATHANERHYTLSLDFESDNRLTGWELVHADQELIWFMNAEYRPVVPADADERAP